MNITQIPHQLTVFGCRSLVIVPGRPPLCLRCNRIGHIRRECRTPRCGECRRYGHPTDECVTTYADKLRQVRTPLDDVVQDHLMDISEMVDATGEVIDSVAPRTERETASQEAQTTNPVSHDVTAEPSCSQQPLPRRERSTTSTGASVKRPAPKADFSQPSGMGAEKESKNDEGGEAKRKPAALREDPYSLASQPDNETKDNE
ncbi:hypothetical protein HPB47_017544, partial [Ixodes persulcatus]